MLNPTWAFQVPEALKLAYEADKVLRFGSILKDAGTGRIIGHLQETGVLQSLLGNVVGVASNVGLGPVLGVATVFQNVQINSKLKALQETVGNLQTLTTFTAAASVVGIGVSIAGTALVLRRLGQVDQSIADLHQKSDALARTLDQLHLKRDLTEAQTVLDRLGEVPAWADAEPLVRRSEERLHSCLANLGQAAGDLASRPTIDSDALDPIITAMGMIGAAQVHTLLWLNESAAARQRSTKIAQTFGALAWRLPPDLLLQRGGAGGSRLSATLREVRDQTATQPMLLAHLDTLGVQGRAYLDRLAQESTEPVLLLPA